MRLPSDIVQLFLADLKVTAPPAVVTEGDKLYLDTS